MFQIQRVDDATQKVVADIQVQFAFNYREGVTVAIITVVGAAKTGGGAVHVKPCDEFAITGTAFCSDKDEFNKVKGMRVALENAMHKTKLSKEDKAVIWGEWKKRHIDGKPSGKKHQMTIAQAFALNRCNCQGGCKAGV